MPRNPANYPTELELKLLGVLWEASPLTVREIRNALARQGRDLAHTTVITTLGIMVQKRYLEKLDPVQGKAFRFQPLVSQSDVSKNMLGDLVKRLFNGSTEAAMLTLFDVDDIDEDEIKRLRRLINKKLREKSDG